MLLFTCYIGIEIPENRDLLVADEDEKPTGEELEVLDGMPRLHDWLFIVPEPVQLPNTTHRCINNNGHNYQQLDRNFHANLWAERLILLSVLIFVLGKH